VNEAVIAAVFRLNEAVALFGVEEFYGADWHEMSLSRTMVARPRKCGQAVRQNRHLKGNRRQKPQPVAPKRRKAEIHCRSPSQNSTSAGAR
jgi:hypothetical protein